MSVTVKKRALLVRAKQADAAAKNMTDPFKWAQRHLGDTFAANFMSNGLRVGGWAPLSPKYAAWKSSRFPGTPTLVRTTKLFRAVKSLDGANTIITPKFARLGVSVDYAKFHQYGTTRMPKRQIIFVPVEFRKMLGSKMASHIIQAANSFPSKGSMKSVNSFGGRF